jgi:DNA-binding XRE family transcriptional regulator
MSIVVSRDAEKGVDIREAAYTMAVAVVVDRIRSLPKEDKDDLFALVQALVTAETPEEERAAAVGFKEILDQAPVTVRHMKLPEQEPPDTLRKWAQWVGGKIREAREEAKLTQADLADRCGLQQSHVSRLESGMHSPSRMTIEKIADALSKPVSYFDPSAGE